MADLTLAASVDLPSLYVEAKRSISECARHDECVEWADRAAALRAYAKQAEDDELYRAAIRIQSRAMRRAGELLEEFQVPHGIGRPKGNGVGAGTISQREAAEAAGMSKRQEVTARRLAAIPDDEFEKLVEAPKPPTITALASGKHNHRAQGTGVNEWYTPREYIQKAAAVLGHIELDPASTAEANRTVRAERFYTVDDDALNREWHGTVWLNPPYSQPLIQQFVDKLVAEHRWGGTTAAILLTHNYTDTRWWHTAADEAAAICFTRGRVKFYGPGGVIASPTQGQCLFYFGPDDAAFWTHFQDVGHIR